MCDRARRGTRASFAKGGGAHNPDGKTLESNLQNLMPRQPSSLQRMQLLGFPARSNSTSFLPIALNFVLHVREDVLFVGHVREDVLFSCDSGVAGVPPPGALGDAGIESTAGVSAATRARFAIGARSTSSAEFALRAAAFCDE